MSLFFNPYNMKNTKAQKRIYLAGATLGGIILALINFNII